MIYAPTNGKGVNSLVERDNPIKNPPKTKFWILGFSEYLSKKIKDNIIQNNKAISYLK